MPASAELSFLSCPLGILRELRYPVFIATDFIIPLGTLSTSIFPTHADDRKAMLKVAIYPRIVL